MSILKRIEKQLEEKLKSAFTPADAPSTDREMIEIHRAVLDDIAGRVQPAGRGRRAFPFNHVVVRVSTPTPERRAMYDAMFGNGEQFLEDVRGALAEAGVDAPADLDVQLQPEDAELPGGYHVSFGKRESTPQAPQKPAEQLAPAAAKLSIIHGAAEEPFYEISTARINIGRLAEVVDDQQRLVRRNNIVFVEAAEGPNATVSRAHAHIAWDSSTATYRLFDDGSAYGTSIFREGALLQIPAGAGRGVALRSGDEIYLGQARLRFES
jgi:hypothetical protein